MFLGSGVGLGGRKLARQRILAALAACALAVGACTALPDTSGYTAASLQLKSAAAAAGTALSAELGRMAGQVPESRRADATAIATNFDAAWKTTVDSLGALGRYAESIEEVTRAGNGGGEAARGVAASVSSLAGALGVVPGAALVGVATDTFALLNTQIANIRAARSLERSLDIADPLVQDMANVVAGQIGTARTLFTQAIDFQRSALDFSVDDISGLDSQLQQMENEAAITLAGLAAQGASEDRRRSAEAALKRVRDGRAALAPRMTAYAAAREALAARARAGAELFAASERALASWRESHQKLVRAIRERRPVSFQSLAAASEDIRTLIERWRDL